MEMFTGDGFRFTKELQGKIVITEPIIEYADYNGFRLPPKEGYMWVNQFPCTVAEIPIADYKCGFED